MLMKFTPEWHFISQEKNRKVLKREKNVLPTLNEKRRFRCSDPLKLRYFYYPLSEQKAMSPHRASQPF
jgi:hypothetical protein